MSLSATISNAAHQALESLGSSWPLQRDLKVRWFNRWHPALNDALAAIPQSGDCPHDLFRQLTQDESNRRKRVALVTRGGTPVAVVGVRPREGRAWELTTDFLTPGFLFPCQPHMEHRALAALGIKVFVNWWRMSQPPPTSREVAALKSVPTYKLHFADDFRKHWDEHGLLRDIKRTQRKCEDYVFAVNAPGAAEWITRSWGETWEVSADQVSDRLIAARYLETIGRHFSVTLSENSQWIAGMTVLLHRNEALGLTNCRNAAYEKDGVGKHLMALTFEWAQQRGLLGFDLGGGHDSYKSRWAPQSGERWCFEVTPLLLNLSMRLKRRIRTYVR